MTKLDGKVALISGSGRGIGREIALKLGGEGACIVVNDLDAAVAYAKSSGKADATKLAVRSAETRSMTALLVTLVGLGLVLMV